MTREEFNKKLKEFDIPERWYSIEGDLKFDAHNLHKWTHQWEYFYLDERGGRNDYTLFWGDDDAFDFLWERLKRNLDFRI